MDADFHFLSKNPLAMKLNDNPNQSSKQNIRQMTMRVCVLVSVYTIVH